MTLHKGGVLLSIVLSAWSASAQLPTLSYEKLLLPIVSSAVAGREGSTWQTTVTLANHANIPVSVYPYNPGVGCTCPIPPLPPNITLTFSGPPSDVPGSFLYVDRANVAAIDVNIRVRETTHDDNSWGVAIPVIREASFRSDVISLLDVPTDSRFRHTLRIYTLDPTRTATIRITVFATDPQNQQTANATPDRLLGTRTVDMPSRVTTVDFPTVPSYAEINDLRSLADTTSATRLRIDVAPVSPNDAVWAFLTVTETATQRVAVITPKP